MRRQVQHWDGRGHFFAAAAEAMRRILVEKARRKGRDLQRAGSGGMQTSTRSTPVDDRLSTSDAACRLGMVDPQAAQHRKRRLVKLRFFAGMTIDEVAGLSVIPTHCRPQVDVAALAGARD